MHYDLKAETLKFFTPPMARKLVDCAKEVGEVLSKHKCFLMVNDGQIQIVSKE